jgi:molybdenum cofactor cytidylyltransferase
LKSDPQPYTAILLAAGAGNRFGGLKQLEEVNGRPLLGRSMERVGEINWKHDPVIVLGYRAETIEEEFNIDRFNVVRNGHWREGMSTSVKKGVSEAESESQGYFLFLGDMPAVPVSAIKNVLDSAKHGASIAAPEYRGQRGFPVYLDKKWKGDLLEEISGDRGARRIIEGNRNELELVEVNKKGVLMDVDDRSDLEEVELYLKEEGNKIGV